MKQISKVISTINGITETLYFESREVAEKLTKAMEKVLPAGATNFEFSEVELLDERDVIMGLLTAAHGKPFDIRSN